MTDLSRPASETPRTGLDLEHTFNKASLASAVLWVACATALTAHVGRCAYQIYKNVTAERVEQSAYPTPSVPYKGPFFPF